MVWVRVAAGGRCWSLWFEGHGVAVLGSVLTWLGSSESLKTFKIEIPDQKILFDLKFKIGLESSLVFESQDNRPVFRRRKSARDGVEKNPQ